jgi:hypothetical protein
MSDANTLPFDFIEYLCAERNIERSAALKLVATELSELSALARGEPATPRASTQGDHPPTELPGKR